MSEDASGRRVNPRVVGLFALFVVLISGMVIAADVFSVRDRNVGKRHGWFSDLNRLRPNIGGTPMPQCGQDACVT
jgi:hypothetical protein